MNDTDYEIDIFTREEQKLKKESKKLIEIIEHPPPHQRYFYILDEIKKVQGTKEMSSKRLLSWLMRVHNWKNISWKQQKILEKPKKNLENNYLLLMEK